MDKDVIQVPPNRTNEKETRMLPLKKIVAPTDFSSESKSGVRAAAEIAEHFSACLHLVYVVSPLPPIPGSTAPVGFHLPGVLKELQGMAETSLEDLVEKELPPDMDLEQHILIGDPAMEIVKFSDEIEADIIVMATFGQTGWRRLVSGSVTEKVIRHASIPVLAFRHQDAAKEEKNDPTE